MKLRVYFRPGIPVALLGGVAAAAWCAFVALGPGWRLVALPFALFYSVLFAIGLWCLWRIVRLERPMRWDTPQRLLILSPHEDDCTIGAGGVGARNARLGGATRIAYLAPDETPGMAEVRARESVAAWRLAGVASLRGLLSSARYRLKWAQLLLSHPEQQVCAAAMRNGFMTLMIGLSGVPEADELMPFLQDAYHLWGGQGYYMSSPPRHPLKRLVAEGTLRLGGLVALNWLLKQTRRQGPNPQPLAGYDPPRTDSDNADVAAIRSVE